VTPVEGVVPRLTLCFDRTLGRRFYRLHARLYRWSGGRLGHHSGLGPILLLTTRGRRTGIPRTTPLLYLPDGEDCLVVASNGGRDRAPDWLGNLAADPEVRIQVGRRTMDARGEVLDDDARAGVWPRMVRHYRGWSEYQRLTDRPLAVVRLRPRVSP
jgi:deazaflavin-dependent oxidoreductase (nitroreductase family)